MLNQNGKKPETFEHEKLNELIIYIKKSINKTSNNDIKIKINNFIEWIMKYSIQYNIQYFTFWLNQILCKNKSDNMYFIKKYYFNDEFKSDQNSINECVNIIQSKFNAFYKDNIKITNKICNDCGYINTLNVYGATKMKHNYWLNPSSFIYPSKISFCKLCGYSFSDIKSMDNEDIKMNSDDIKIDNFGNFDINGNNSDNKDTSMNGKSKTLDGKIEVLKKEFNMVYKSNEITSNVHNVTVNNRSLKRLVFILTKFCRERTAAAYNYNLMFKTQEYIGYNFMNILTDYDTLLFNETNMTKTILYSIKKEYLDVRKKCQFNNECLHLANIYRRRNNTENIRDINNQYKYDIIGKVHILLYHYSIHKLYEGYKSVPIIYSKNHEKFELNKHLCANMNNNEILLEYYKIPIIKYKSMLDELLNNNIFQISKSQWKNELTKGKLIHKQKSLQKMKMVFSYHGNTLGDVCDQSNSLFYGLLYGDIITFDCILAILFYCNYVELNIAFKNECIVNKYTEYNNKAIKSYQALEFYYFGRFIYKTCEFFGKNDILTSFYMGIKNMGVFSTFSPLFKNIPLSLTPKFETADVYAKIDGIVVELKSKYRKNSIKYFNATWISDFGFLETEYICYGNNHFIITNLFDYNNTRYSKFVKCLQFFESFISQHNHINNNTKLNSSSNILNSTEKTILIGLLKCSVNNKMDNSIPFYGYKLIKHFCNSKTGNKTNCDINFNGIHTNKFIIHFDELLSMILMDNYIKDELSNQYFPFDIMKLKQLFVNSKGFINNKGYYVSYS